MNMRDEGKGGAKRVQCAWPVPVQWPAEKSQAGDDLNRLPDGPGWWPESPVMRLIVLK